MLEDERPGLEPGRRVVVLGVGVFRVLGLRLAVDELRVVDERPTFEPGRWLDVLGVGALRVLVLGRLLVAGVWLTRRSAVDALRLLEPLPVELEDLG